MSERTAEEWGRVAVNLPGWRWMPGMRVRSGSVRSWGMAVTVPPDGFVDYWDPEFEELVTGTHPSWLDIDPDDPATAGCLFDLLGGPHTLAPCVENYVSGGPCGGITSLGRACIADAAAIGRWPGGGA